MSKPPRRKASKLANLHPAYPQTPPVPEDAPERAPEHPSAPALVASQPRDHEAAPTPGPAPSPQRAPEEARTRPRAYARTREREREVRRQVARSRTEARNAAYAWRSARKKLDDRTEEWVEMLRRARSLGESPEVLAEIVREAAQQAGVSATDVPAAVWQAAGLDLPQT